MCSSQAPNGAGMSRVLRDDTGKEHFQKGARLPTGSGLAVAALLGV